MNSHPIITVIGFLSTDQIVIMSRFPDSGESLPASDLYVRCSGKDANTSVVTYRLSHNKPKKSSDDSRASNGVSSNGVLNNDLPSNDVQVRLTDAIGREGRGPLIIDNLQQNGVDTSSVLKVDEIDTELCIGIVESDTRENRLLLIPGAIHYLRPHNRLTLESLAGGFKPDLFVSILVIPRDTAESILETAAV